MISQQTQETLGKYGVQPQKISNVQNQKNENINRIEIVEAPIPVSSPQISVSPVNIAVERYKKWLTENFERQKQQSQGERKDLKEKERSLGILGSKLFRKIEELSRNISEKFSASNMQAVFTSKLNPVLMILGTTILPSFWTPFTRILTNIEYGIRSFFGLGPAEGVSVKMAEELGGWNFVQGLKFFLGGRGELGDKSFIRVLGELMLSGVEHFMERSKLILKERGELLDTLEKPEHSRLGLAWDAIAEMTGKEDLLGTGAIRDWLSYFGDILGISLGGESYMSWKISKEQKEETGKNIKDNDLINHNSAESLKKKGIILDSRIDRYINEEGEFDGSKDPLTAALTLSNFTVTAIQDTTKKNIGSTQYGLSNLADLASSEGMVPVTQEFANLLDHNTRLRLQESGDIEVREGYSYVSSGGVTRLVENSNLGSYKGSKRVATKGVLFLSKKAIKAVTDGDDSYSGRGFEKIRDRIEENYKRKKKVSYVPNDLRSDISEEHQKVYDIMAASNRNIDILDTEDTTWNNFVNNVRYSIFGDDMKDIVFGETLPATGDQVSPENRDKRFDIKEAIKKIHSPVHLKTDSYEGTIIPGQNTDTKHSCASSVRQFFEAGRLSTNGHPRYAKDYNSFMPKMGFVRIDPGSQPRPGDVIVNDYKPYGHIQMFDGKNWVSDFKQNAPLDKGTKTMWRFPQNGDPLPEAKKRVASKNSVSTEKNGEPEKKSPKVTFTNGISGTKLGAIEGETSPSPKASFTPVSTPVSSPSYEAPTMSSSEDGVWINNEGISLIKNIEQTSGTAVKLKSKK